ncbi:cytochrome c [Spirulina sp. CS-785/01]|uniref:cytochrome c n=1 Tax=Spirulina sp. CS-785/01 TaxID=3021716 RepID=UPI00232DD35C|nr:cytochrome c [Spirulina sp. CS-785/01]MDB9315323.1 cytochrome c [Spirulina sp. CS-785/01]
MTNQTAQPRVLVQRLAIIFIAAVAVLLASTVSVYLYRVSDPYIQQVLELDGNPERGHAIFEINCAGCHGAYATGDVGPSLEHISHRKSDVTLIQQVISGNTPPMPKFQPSPQDMADLLSYMKRL